MKKIISVIAIAVSLIHFRADASGDVNAGRMKAKTCVACHGAEGISNNALWPNLAGQKDQYIVIQLKAFKDGSRVHPMMTPIAKMLSDQDMENLAAYFSSLKD